LLMKMAFAHELVVQVDDFPRMARAQDLPLPE